MNEILGSELYKDITRMFGIENYLGFIAAGIILNLTPGTDTMYILTRSISQGRKAGIYSVLGITTGGLIHTVFASLGLSIILAESATAFAVVKYIGVTYLVYLGIKMILDKKNSFDNDNQKIEQLNLKKIYRQGVITNVLNPKVALFFLALLPQFINPDYASGTLPFMILGVTFMTTGTLWCLFLAFTASLITKTLRENDKTGMVMQKISGLIFIGLGIKLLAQKQ
ncbi:LysE family translocator [Saccharicrinis sp. FJH2]|uniref:LysE family translocator n=1 Tax=Saccharicrinis sp. FJH65 TaxID=3344659 RepID=UPI0035F28DFC